MFEKVAFLLFVTVPPIHLYLIPPSWVLYMSSSFWLLVNRSRDLFQDEKRITIVKAEQIQKMATIFTQNDNQKFSISYFIVENQWILSKNGFV